MHEAGAHLAGGDSLLCQVGSFGNLLGENSVQAKFTRKAPAPGPEGLPQGAMIRPARIIRILCT
jgi:hypothetical protein